MIRGIARSSGRGQNKLVPTVFFLAGDPCPKTVGKRALLGDLGCIGFARHGLAD